MALSTQEVADVNSCCPVLRKTTLGTEIAANTTNVAALTSVADTSILQLTAEITADASSTAVNFTIPVACEVLDIIVQSKATSGLGTATVRKVTTAISDAIIMAVDTTITRAGTIDVAQSILAAGDDVNVIAAGGTDRGLITLICRRL